MSMQGEGKERQVGAHTPQHAMVQNNGIKNLHNGSYTVISSHWSHTLGGRNGKLKPSFELVEGVLEEEGRGDMEREERHVVVEER